MNNFISVHSVNDIEELLFDALQTKKKPYAYSSLGKNKTLGLIFLNPSLRTRLSTQKAGMNLGMQVMVMNAAQEAWTWEFSENAVMNGNAVEHIKDAARVVSGYCDIIGIRCFPGLKNKEEDYGEKVLNTFLKYCKVPVISLESATLHPLQSFADLVTIAENTKKKKKPKVVLCWAPHIKALPQAVPNSFAQWMLRWNADFTIAQPKGYELNSEFTKGAKICYDKEEVIYDADFIYVKNWSSFTTYGQMPEVKQNWLLEGKIVDKNKNVKIMHCLPVRRNVELKDALIDSPNSLVYEQAFNRTVAAQTVLKNILKEI